MTGLFTRLGFFFLRLLHWLPLSAQAAIGGALARLAYPFAGRRRRIARRNLELCFPEKAPAKSNACCAPTSWPPPAPRSSTAC